ncbi:MAG: Fe-S-cluster containining protein [Bradymonadia bacterium]
MELLPEERRVRVMSRIAESAKEERAYFGSLPTVDADESRFDAMCDSLSERACVFLDSGNRCTIYDRRPQPCRLMGASWGIGAAQFELDCPIDLTGGDARVVFDLDTHEDAIARVESRLPELPTGDSRTTLASGLDALLRG